MSETNDTSIPTPEVTPDATAPDFFADFETNFGEAGEAPTETPTPAEGEAAPAGYVVADEEAPGVDEASALREEIGRMAAVMASHGISFIEAPGEVVEVADEEGAPVIAPTQVAPAPSWGPTVVVSDDDFQASLENKGTFEKILTTVRDQAVERTIQSIPQLVGSMIKQQLYLNELSREFYQANEDLAGIRPFVGVIANEIASKNPGLKPEEVLEKTAVEARKRLQLKVKTETPTPGPGPGLPGAASRQRPSTPNLSSLEKELAEMQGVM